MTEFIITCKSELKPDGSYQIERYRELVRCKDCKHRPTYPETGAEIDGKWYYWCELHRDWKHDDWFCADGEAKKDQLSSMYGIMEDNNG